MHIPAWLDRLTPHAARLAGTRLDDLLRDPGWCAQGFLRLGPLLACFARQRLDQAALDALHALARERQVPEAIEALFEGAPVNRSEGRAALHTALRSNLGASDAARAARELAESARQAMLRQLAWLEDSALTDLIHIGIGGSDHGPRLVMGALGHLDRGRFRVHFLSTLDAHAAQRLLARLDPRRTAAILVSKSFGTPETLRNGRLVAEWLGPGAVMLAITARADRAREFGLAEERILPLWDWVGGRYSLWSAVGFVVAAALGVEAWDGLRAGAARMDAHVRQAALEQNIAVRHALVSIWNRNALGLASHAILPYDSRLAQLPAYLQQLVMESLGKSVCTDGRVVDCATGPVLWGGAATDAQHSFFQALHQGTDLVPLDFIGVVQPEHGHAAQHRALLANLLAQSQVLASGARPGDPQRHHPGNRPSTILLLDQLSPETLGMLLALYEHSVCIQAAIWGINPFDQWGVELGKRVAADLEARLEAAGGEDGDPVTRRLIGEIRERAG